MTGVVGDYQNPEHFTTTTGSSVIEAKIVLPVSATLEMLLQITGSNQRQWMGSVIKRKGEAGWGSERTSSLRQLVQEMVG